MKQRSKSLKNSPAVAVANRRSNMRGLFLLLILGLGGRYTYDLHTRNTERSDSPIAERAVLSTYPEDKSRSATRPRELTGRSSESEGDAILDRVRELTEAGETTAAVGLLEEALRKEPNQISYLMELAIIVVLDLKDQSRGQKLFERVVELDPLNRSALNELLILYEDQDRLDDGLEFLHGRLQVEKDVSEIQYAHAKLLARAGKPEEAMASFDATKNLKDIQDQVYLDLAETALAQGNAARAIPAIEAALKIQESELQLSKEKQDEALDFLEDRVVATKVMYVRALLRAGRVEEATSVLDGISGRDADPIVSAVRREVSSAARL